ncbi:MAG: prepilin-type N-terminal cleavage/methylation domain-containing protein [Candidatus Pacebacteria bacterium]|nr:prepilin-type N-terminal cleavage/methylation domain-containing protein [Candidatus Paceibacterota bacterium]
MNRLVKQAFTLIELLVVIAIVGILSGLIIVTMNGVTQKANIAKSQIFSNSLRNALMLNLVSEWKFDGNANDSWGSNNGSIFGTITQSSDCIYDTCYFFNGGGSIDCGGADNLNSANALTIDFWFKTSSNNKDIFNKAVGAGNQRAFVVFIDSSGKMEFTISADGVSWPGLITGNNIVSDGKWNYATCVYDGSKIYLYLNGMSDKTPVNYSGGIFPSTAIFKIGASYYIAPYVGSMDQMRFFKAALPTSYIKEQYYSGLNSLLSKGRITNEEYVSRIKEVGMNIDAPHNRFKIYKNIC